MRSRSRSAILLALLAAGCNCAKQPGPTPLVEGASPDVEVAPADDSFLYARLSARLARVPARFDAPLPASVESFRGQWAEDRPPRAYVRDQLCRGDRAMGDRLARAVDAASAAGGTAQELASTYGRMVEYCATPAFCAWAQAQASDEGRSAAFRAVVWTGLARCPAPIVEAVIGRPGVPPSALVRFHRGRVFAQRGRPLPMPDGMVEAVRAVVQVEGGYDAEHEAGVAIDTLARMEGGAAAIVALDAELVAHRDRIGMALWNATDPRLRRLFDGACARVPTAHQCRQRRAPVGVEEAQGESARAPTADELVRDYGFDAPAYLAEHPSEREAVLGALERCGQEREYPGAGCLASLARLDWARARAVAIAAPAPDEGRAGEVRRTLRTYETPEALGARLVEVGLLRSAPREPAITVEDALSLAGALHRFDTETGQFPNEHDSLLRELAALAPEALPGARFLEIAPGSSGGGLALDDGTSLRPDSIGGEDDLAEEGPYTLVAYVDGEELRTDAENLGDWYDVGAVVGMLNELARRRGDPTRWQVLPTGDQSATVIAAPGPAIRRAIREGLLEGEDADRARQDGREFERRAFEALGR